MILTTSLAALALQVGFNPNHVPLTDGHQELRDRPAREEEATAQNPASAWLSECLTLLDQDAARAHTMAQIRRNETNGAERVVANHCLGLAATELMLWEDAINAFTAARDETPPDEMRARARFGAIAGNAALAGGDAVRAEALLSQAKLDAQSAASAPLQALAASDLARALVALNRPAAALTELEFATQIAPDNAEAWLLTATLLRRLNRLDEAQIAIEQAGTQAPLDPLVGLEAGVIAVLAGRDEAARASWQSVIDLGSESPAAATAQDYLAQLGPPQAESAAQEPL